MKPKKLKISYSTVPHRALRICHAIRFRRAEMTPVGNGYGELRIGPFTILHAPPESYPNGPCHNVNIWRHGKSKVANIEWNECDGLAIVDIISFRSGAWEKELLELLSAQGSEDSIH